VAGAGAGWSACHDPNLSATCSAFAHPLSVHTAGWSDRMTLLSPVFTPKEFRHIARGCRASRLPRVAEKQRRTPRGFRPVSSSSNLNSRQITRPLRSHRVPTMWTSTAIRDCGISLSPVDSTLTGYAVVFVATPGYKPELLEYSGTADQQKAPVGSRWDLVANVVSADRGFAKRSNPGDLAAEDTGGPKLPPVAPKSGRWTSKCACRTSQQTVPPRPLQPAPAPATPD